MVHVEKVPILPIHRACPDPIGEFIGAERYGYNTSGYGLDMSIQAEQVLQLAT